MAGIINVNEDHSNLMIYPLGSNAFYASMNGSNVMKI
jgi:hypothetical protein